MTARRGGLGTAFTNVYVASLASNLGDGIARIASPLLAVRLTDDALLVAGVAAIAMVPWLLFAIPAGMIVDRIDRRTALAAANFLRGALGVVLLVLAATGTLTIWWLYVVIFIYGMGETVYDTAARAVIPSVVAKPDLPRANGRMEAGELVVQNFLAGPFTSVLFAVSVLIPLGTNALVFAASAVLALLLPRAAAGSHVDSATERTTLRRQYTDGFRFIFSNRMLATLLLLSTFIGFWFSASTASFALFLIDDLGLPEALFGVFMLSGAVGGILGSVLAPRLKARFGAGSTMAGANLLATVTFLVLGLFPSLVMAAVVYFLSSAAVIVWNVLVMSLRQSIIPGRLLGRVHGSWRTLLWGTMPLGSLVGGLLGRVDLALPFAVGGGVATVAALVYFRFLTTLPNPEDVDNGDDAQPSAGTVPPVV